MALLDVNELVQTIVDQAHTIRRMGMEIERLRTEITTELERLAVERSKNAPTVSPTEE